MAKLNFVEGRYTLVHLLRTVTAHGPALVKGWRRTVGNVRGPEKLPGKLGIALYLRMARLMGCPVCAAYFPGLARSRGFTEEQIAGCLGDRDASPLSAEQRAALEYGERLLHNDSEAVETLDTTLSALRLSQVTAFVRTSMLIHAVGLMALPRAVVERTRRPR